MSIALFRDGGDKAFEVVVGEIRKLESELRLRNEIEAQRAQAQDVASLTERRDFSLQELASEDILARILDLERAIYGGDEIVDAETFVDRLLAEAGPIEPGTVSPVRRNSDAVVALVHTNSLKPAEDGGWKLEPPEPLVHDLFELCPHERFLEELSGAFGSGVLIGERTILTASHCIRRGVNLEDLYFVFGYERRSGVPIRTFGEGDVFAGAATTVIAESFEEEEDWVLLTLDRPVGRKPAQAREEDLVEAGDDVYVIGHPLGMAKKGAGGAWVRDNSPENAFFANLDVYEGSSGSPVFNAVTHALEGIVVNGEKPLEPFWSNGSHCNVTRKCGDNDCRGETVRRILRILNQVDVDL